MSRESNDEIRQLGEQLVAQHSPLTPEGQIESVASFARGATKVSGWQRPTAKVVAGLISLSIVMVAVAAVVDFIRT